ncbi:MAG: amidohydrolase family protein, partial [Myxococcales bacterium]|nr:amidohydrolase family protein [Myxococcales bacterium]
GYPTQSWGRDGYGLEVPNAEAGRAAVAKLAGLGARFIKVPFQGEAQLSDEIAAAVIDEAHLRGLHVAVHALGDADAARAGRLGADILAHTPVEPLQPATLDLWAGKTVVSTLGAFGGADSTVANLRALRERGATVLYGTDFGNTTVAGVDPRELTLLSRAGLDGAAVLAAGTTAPATFWGFADLGALAPGKAATFMVLRDDPRVVPSTLSSPASVWVRGLATGGGVGAGGSRGGRGG